MSREILVHFVSVCGYEWIQQGRRCGHGHHSVPQVVTGPGRSFQGAVLSHVVQRIGWGSGVSDGEGWGQGRCHHPSRTYDGQLSGISTQEAGVLK